MTHSLSDNERKGVREIPYTFMEHATFKLLPRSSETSSMRLAAPPKVICVV
jgi:hypothetical protein